MQFMSGIDSGPFFDIKAAIVPLSHDIPLMWLMFVATSLLLAAHSSPFCVLCLVVRRTWPVLHKLMKLPTHTESEVSYKLLTDTHTNIHIWTC